MKNLSKSSEIQKKRKTRNPENDNLILLNVESGMFRGFMEKTSNYQIHYLVCYCFQCFVGFRCWGIFFFRLSYGDRLSLGWDYEINERNQTEVTCTSSISIFRGLSKSNPRLQLVQIRPLTPFLTNTSDDFLRGSAFWKLHSIWIQISSFWRWPATLWSNQFQSQGNKNWNTKPIQFGI